MAESITLTLHDLVQCIYSEVQASTENSAPLENNVSAKVAIGLTATQLPDNEACDVSIQNIKSGTTIYIGDATNQEIVLPYLSSYKTGYIGNLNTIYAKCSDASGEIAILGRKK